MKIESTGQINKVIFIKSKNDSLDSKLGFEKTTISMK